MYTTGDVNLTTVYYLNGSSLALFELTTLLMPNLPSLLDLIDGVTAAPDILLGGGPSENEDADGGRSVDWKTSGLSER